MLKERRAAGQKRIDQLVLNLDLVSPVRRCAFANEFRPPGLEIHGPASAMVTGYLQQEFGVNAATGRFSLGSHQIVEVLHQALRKVTSCGICRSAMGANLRRNPV